MLRMFAISTVGIVALVAAIPSFARRDDAQLQRRVAHHLSHWCAQELGKTSTCPKNAAMVPLPDSYFISPLRRDAWRFACEATVACVAFSVGQDTASEADDVSSISLVASTIE